MFKKGCGRHKIANKLTFFTKFVLYSNYSIFMLMSSVPIFFGFLVFFWVPMIGGSVIFIITGLLARPTQQLSSWMHRDKNASKAEERQAMKNTHKTLFCTGMTPLVCFYLTVFVRWAPPNNELYWRSLWITVMERRFMTQINHAREEEIAAANVAWFII